jgi:hypothetical protein
MHILVGFGYFPGTTGLHLQAAFAKQHQVTYVGTSWAAHHQPGFAPNVDLAALVARLDTPPDLFVYIDSGNVAYAPVGLEKLPCPTAAYLIDAYPPHTGLINKFRLRLAPLFDYVFVAHRGCEALYSSWRSDLPVHWLPLACDPEIHRDHQLERIYDIGFVGQVNASYPNRVRALKALSARYRLNDYSRPYYMEEMARIYSESKIVFNITLQGLLNCRIFEAPPCGALLLTEHSDHNGQGELFTEGEHFVTFRDVDDLIQKVDYYLAHVEEREKIARAGQAHVLQHHTYANRVQTLLDVIAADGTRLRAPVRSWTNSQRTRHYLELHSQLRLIDAVMDQRWQEVPGRYRLTKQARQGYYALTALLRRIKHQWR